MARLILLNKPFGMPCQFRPEGGRPSLTDVLDVPGVYPAGRLDADSEGLVVLTADGDVPEGIDSSASLQSLPVYDLVHSYREYGHLAADLDPLGSSPRSNPLLDLTAFAISEANLVQRVSCKTFKAFQDGTIAEILQALRETYCGHVAVEFIDDDELVEVTPKNIRLRKRHLLEHDRKRATREEQAA